MALARVTGSLSERSQLEKEQTALARVGHAVSLLKPGQDGHVLYGLALKARWAEYEAIRDLGIETARSSVRVAARRLREENRQDAQQGSSDLRSTSFRGQRISRTIPPASA